ncbi:hypothetical protein D3C80_1023930 [compost metagenome]
MGAQGVGRLGRLDRQGHARQDEGAEVASLCPLRQLEDVHAHRLQDVGVDGAREFQIRCARRQRASTAVALGRAGPAHIGRQGTRRRNDPHGAPAFGFVRLVAARLIGGGVGAVEQIAVGLAAEDQHDLAGHVEVAVVVPAALGRGDAVADKDHAGVGDRSLAVIADRPQQDVGPSGQGMDLTIRAAPAGLRSVGDRGVALQVNDLQPLAVRTARLQPHGLVLGLQPVQGLLFALRAGIAALEVIGADDADFIRQALGGKILGRSRTGGEQKGRGGDAADESTRHGNSFTLPTGHWLKVIGRPLARPPLNVLSFSVTADRPAYLRSASLTARAGPNSEPGFHWGQSRLLARAWPASKTTCRSWIMPR